VLCLKQFNKLRPIVHAVDNSTWLLQQTSLGFPAINASNFFCCVKVIATLQIRPHSTATEAAFSAPSCLHAAGTAPQLC
jgi:hypothetical protein